MATDSSERLWAQAVDDGNYVEAINITEQEAASKRRRDRMKSTLAAYADPSHPLYTPILPRDVDCMDKSDIQPGECEL